MQFPLPISSSITPAKAQKVLADNGMLVSLEEAEGILQFLLKLATLSQQVQPNEEGLSIHTREHRRAS